MWATWLVNSNVYYLNDQLQLFNLYNCIVLVIEAGNALELDITQVGTFLYGRLRLILRYAHIYTHITCGMC